MDKEHPLVLICDGHGSHISLPALDLCREHGIHVVLRPPHTSHILQLEDVANFREFKPLLRVQVASQLTRKALAQVRESDEMPSAVLGNEDLMACVREPWMTAFRKAKCVTGWAMTGLYPFTRRVYWEVKAAEDRRSKDRQRTEERTGVQWSAFTLQGPLQRPDKRRRLVGAAEGLGEDTDSDDEEQQQQAGMGRLNSSMLWNNKGGITADEAYNKVVAKQQHTDAKAAEKEQRKEQRTAAAEANRLAASSAADTVRDVVTRQQGWQTGRGGLTKVLLTQVVLWFNQRVGQHDKVADLVVRVQALMGWVDGVGFPPPPPPVAQVRQG